MGSFHILTLGCPKNTADSETLHTLLTSEGISPTQNAEEADIILLNTCGFIEDAKKESIDGILDLAEAKTAGQRLVVFGCLSQRYFESLKNEIPEVDAFFGIEKHDDILGYCKSVVPAPRIEQIPPDIQDSAPGLNKNEPVLQQLEPSRSRPASCAYIKIADGCDRSCSFCVIPEIKGSFRSDLPDSILKKAEELIRQGRKELILVAQDITSYRGFNRGYGLSNLLTDICSISGDFQVRLLYLYPTAIDDRLLDTIAGQPRICKYMDIPLQHSEERILKLMKRPGSRSSYLTLLNRIRNAIPGVTLRTSFIVGFPSETDEEFEALLDFVREVEFERMGSFVYSREEGTYAYGLEGQLSRKIKDARFHEIMTLQSGISLEKNRSMVGKSVRALVDGIDGDTAVCRYEGQAPDIDGVTLINADEASILPGNFIDIKITEAYDYDLRGVVVD